MPRFYSNTPLASLSELTLPSPIFDHWCKVLRAKIGDIATLFDGTGGEYIATLVAIDKKSARVKLGDFNPINRQAPFDARLLLVMSRGDRMDYAIQKACELGTTHIQLLHSARCNVPLKTAVDKKLAHWQNVAIAACEQCGLNIVPPIAAPIALADFLANPVPQNSTKSHTNPHTRPNHNALPLILSPTPPDIKQDTIAQIRAHFAAQLVTNRRAKFDLLIGCEGGFTNDEVARAVQCGFVSWTLGERILRTETAPVAALAVLTCLAQLNDS